MTCKTIFKYLPGIILTTLFFLGAGCSQEKTSVYMRIAGFTQGTTYHITYEYPDTIDFQQEVDSVLKSFDHSLSTYDSTSIIFAVNRNLDVTTDSLFNYVFDKSREVYDQSDGLFDITVMPLVNAWGFGPGLKEKMNPHHIDSLLQFVGMDKVRIENNKVLKSDPRVQLDVNALAQGYSVDIVVQYLEKKGITNYVVEIGGEIRARGVNPEGKVWRIGIDKPEFGNFIPGAELQAIISLKDKSLATSGNYRKYYEENGVKYTHSLDPKTGYPAKQSLLSATIIADDCITADAYATVCMVGGLEKSKEILNQHPELEAYLIYGDDSGIYQLFITPGMKALIAED
ncbi:MAG: FAD:protein FMN transferase [Bacteroidales bacterium]|nr:FAD:protein FMN transferase [Bacteroidales bacterium]